MLEQILLVIIFVSGILYIVFDYSRKTSLQLIFKPLTTLLIIVLALIQEPNVSNYYKYFVVGGLIFSLMGDIFLMLPKDRFVAGLGSFFVALIFYIFAFADDFGPYLGWTYLIPIAIYAAVFIKILLPHTNKMTLPVIAYILILVIFMWQPAGRFWTLAGDGPSLAFFGAIFLFLSSQ